MRVMTQASYRLRRLERHTGVEERLGLELRAVGILSGPGRAESNSPTFYLYFRLNRLK